MEKLNLCVLNQIVSNLSLADTVNLASGNKQLFRMIYKLPEVTRFVELRPSRAPYVFNIMPALRPTYSSFPWFYQTNKPGFILSMLYVAIC